MEQLKHFFSSFTFFVGFMVLCIFMQMLLGKDVLYKFLWLVLAGMVVTNVSTFTTVLNNAATIPEVAESNSPQSTKKSVFGKTVNPEKLGVVANNEKTNKFGILNGGLHI